MIKMQQARPSPQLHTGRFVGVAALCAVFMAGLAVAEGAAPTPVRPARARHAASDPARNLHAKSYAVSPRGRRLLAHDAPARTETHKPSSKSGSAGPHSKGPSERPLRDAAPKGKSAPHTKARHKRHPDDDDYDAPAMYKTRAGRGGRGPELVRVHGRLSARDMRAREPIADASRFVIGPAPLRGSHDILVHQNLMADDEGLERIQDEDDLDRLRTSHDLVDFEETRSLRLNPELPWNRRCARLWTVKFVQDIATAFYARFGQPLQVNSAARSVEYQLRLAHINGNAAGIDGDVASPHLTGQAIDLGKRGMNRAQLAWMRSRLLPFIENGSIDVEEEFRQACFHISVYRSYLPAARALPKHEFAQLGSQLGTQPVTKTASPHIPMTAPSSSLEPRP